MTNPTPDSAQCEALLTDMRMQVIYTDKVTMPIPLYERMKAALTSVADEDTIMLKSSQSFIAASIKKDGAIPTKQEVCGEVAAPKVNGWRPIESAPKDGTLIICADKNEAGIWARYIAFYTETMRWSEQYWMDNDPDSEYCPAGWFRESSDEEIVNMCSPTHWQPLPKPPTTGEQK